MSIAIGLYDLFSYLIPGVLYLLLINDFLRSTGWRYIELANLHISGDSAPGIFAVVAIGLGAYVTGHIFEAFRSVLLDNWLYHGAPDRAMTKIRRRLSHSNIEVNFHFDDWSIYQEGLKVRNGNLVGDSERYKADALMMRNFSFAGFLYGLLQVVQFSQRIDHWYHLVLFVLGIVVGFLAYRRARRFDEWYYRTIYTQALVYGSNLKEFLENSTPMWKVKQQPKRTQNKKLKNV